MKMKIKVLKIVINDNFKEGIENNTMSFGMRAMCKKDQENEKCYNISQVISYDLIMKD